MYLISDFGNKENKAKRKAAENRMSIDRVYSDTDAYNADSAELAKRKAKELRTIRERRNSDIVDPLKYRSKQTEKKKITAPYTDNTGLAYLPKWEEKGTSEKLGREQNRGSKGDDYIGSNKRISDNPKRQARVDEILKNQREPKVKPSPPKSTTPKVKKVLEDFTKVPEVKFIPPKSKTQTTVNEVKKVANDIPKSTSKGKGGLGLGIALGAGALGLAGIGGAIALANRKKKQKEKNV